MEVTVYTTPTCPWCKKTKTFLKEHDVKFSEVNIKETEDAQNYLMEKTGQFGVPVIKIVEGGKERFIVGYDVKALKDALNLSS